MAVLSNIVEKAREQGKSFEDILSEEESLQTLHGIRSRIEAGGGKAAEDMLTEYDARMRLLADRLEDEKSEDEPKIADVQTLASIINWGNKCKKDGLLEWEQGNWAEAHASWRQADETLRPFKAADKENQKLLTELHVSILKNLAQACIKLGQWGEASKSAGKAVELDPDDHKAWFRKACALEGLGLLEEAEVCLQKIDECSVGRPDRIRIAKETQAKREKFQALRDREQDSLKKTFTKAIEKNLFSEDREQVLRPPVAEQLGDQETQKRPRPTPQGRFQDNTRKHLTREGAEDLLIALRDAYRDTSFQMQVLKLARDVRGEKRAFLSNLKSLALPLQKPVLEKFGFEPNEQGVMEMTRAIQDWTRGPKADASVKRRADETTIALYGVMYDTLTRPDATDAPYRPPMEVRIGRSHEAEEQQDDANG
eukprot:TRINITY_DN23975_c0_g1_i2.p1 TRINITY_DN23975_c0_g1~~TRINITY_DN23975_c0_g1_i2.p1  ORF type:complete len:477 (+),score=119.48 TRINITY_DN23975_c0_g1_i2:155-1432(+)